ncbi:MAG: glycosyltransferase [Flavobacteriales bacterium]|nr:glycosyltransferase [Flavobacteriales bacterium]
MRVVHLNTSDVGGAATAAIQLHLALLELGVGSDLLTLNRTRTDIPRHHRVDPFGLRGDPLMNKVRYKVRRALEVAGLVEDRSNAPGNRNLRRERGAHEIFTLPYAFFDVLDHPLVKAADVVHLHWVSYGMIDHRRFFGRCSKPIIWTLHDMNPFTAGSHHTDDDLSFRDGPDLSPQLRDPRRAQRYWRYKHDAVTAIPVDRLTLVAPSQWLADHAMSSAMFRGRACRVIPNGIDTAVFRPQDKHRARAKLGLSDADRVVLFNALEVDSPRKGMQLLIPALRGLEHERVRLICIGGPGRELPDELEVLRTGYLRDPMVIAAYYAAADLFVLPSLAENLPNTIAEAHCCGTPVVAFRVGGIPEQIDPDNGILVAPRDVNDLRAGIDEALDRSWNNERIAGKAASRYDGRAVAQAYLELYVK